MRDIAEFVRECKGQTLSIRVYGQWFKLSCKSIEPVDWIDIRKYDTRTVVRVQTDIELVRFVWNNVSKSPFKKETILFDVENAVWKAAHLEK